MNTITAYGKVLNLGHRDLKELLLDPVLVQEKYDGSQLTWTWYDNGELHAWSKGRKQFGPGMSISDVDGLFKASIGHLLSVDPLPGYVFRGEAISKPKHNTLCYGRAPNGFIVLFDVELPDNGGFEFGSSSIYADLMGIEFAAVLDYIDGSFIDKDKLDQYLDKESSLGGCKVEGVVIKNYERTNQRTGRPFIAGKFVSEAFKEVHKTSWKMGHEGQGDIVQRIAEALNTEARWVKAVQHLAEVGLLEGDPRDIGPLMQEVKRDTMDEADDFITTTLRAWADKKVERGLGRGLPEWYKARLAAQKWTDVETGLSKLLEEQL